MTIDIREKRLTLSRSGVILSLGEKLPALPNRVSVQVTETIKIPPYSEMEVTAYLAAPVAAGTWLMEGVAGKRAAALVARAVVAPQTNNVVVRLLNPRPQPVKVYQGSEIATLEPVDEPMLLTASVSTAKTHPVSPEKQEMLRDLTKQAGADLKDSERELSYQLLLTYADVFADSDMDLGQTGAIRHQIITEDTSPTRQPVQRIPPSWRPEVQKLLQDMEDRNIIERSSSPWAAPIVLVKKKDGTTRFCVDYRKLNVVTRKDAYPLPLVDMTLDTLSGSQWFSTLDLLSGYWQVEVAEEDRQKTAFCTTEGLFRL